jgi:L-lactate permease
LAANHLADGEAIDAGHLAGDQNREVMVAGGSFAIAQYLSSNFLGPELPDIISSLVSLVCLTLFLKRWQPGGTLHRVTVAVRNRNGDQARMT